MKRAIIYHDFAHQLLQEKLSSQNETTVLIVCSTKNHLLEQIIPVLSAEEPVQKNSRRQSSEADETSEDVASHQLLHTTLQLISASKAIKLAFCPTINTLRAYLSTLTATHSTKPPPQACLLILDLILLHHATSEFSVQGLMRSLASSVEAAARNQMDLYLCECKDILDLDNPDRGPGLWDAQVPLLSGSVRLRGDDAAWSGRMISVRDIAGRWFEFERKEETRDEEVDHDEMLV
jgi:hypothetical protein